MVKQIGLLGVKGSSNSIRIVTSANPVKKAESLFSSLTRNAISKQTYPNGTVVANMDNGNYITFRPISASTTNFEATLSFDFRASGIWTQVRNIKFVAQ